MAITTTTNKSLIKVTVGTENGTWGPYINTDQDLLDNMLGGTATIALTNANVVLSSAQYQCNFITFTGAISANIQITFPAVGSFYTVQNLTSNTSSFQITLKIGAGQAIGVPWGEPIDVMTDGTNVKYKNLDRVGAYWDYAGSSIPAWVSACTIPPYLYCNGTTFSSATYPVLTTILGSTTLPDFRGRYRAYYNDGTGRITSGSGGVDGNTVQASGGVQSQTIAQANIPAYALPVTDPGHTHTYNDNQYNAFFGGAGAIASLAQSANTGSAVTGITVNSGGSGTPLPVLPPTTIGGITMIRAA